MKGFGVRCMFGFGLPAIIGGVSAILSFGVPDVDFQYGGKACWILGFVQDIATFLVPVGIYCTLNLIFFIWTVANIVKIRTITGKVKSSKKETVTFLPYVKLSVILGISWILAFATIIESEAVLYIFVIVNCSQGIFLFVVFISNDKVRKLWGRRGAGGVPSS